MATQDTTNTTPEADAPVVAADATAQTRPAVDAPVDELTVQPVTSGPTNPQVDDAIVNEANNDSTVAGFPKTTNEFGTEQVVINENGEIQGLDAKDQPAATPSE